MIRELLASVSWVQVLANFVPMFFTGTGMFLWLAWYLGRRVERLFVIVATVDGLGNRVLVIEADMGRVKADVGALKERWEDVRDMRRMLESIMLRNAPP